MDTTRGEINKMIRTVARKHANSCGAVTYFAPGVGWLCSSCDEDHKTISEIDSSEAFYPQGS